MSQFISLIIDTRLTKRALDAGDSARFTSSFLDSSFFCFRAESTPAPAPVTQTVGRLKSQVLALMDLTDLQENKMNLNVPESQTEPSNRKEDFESPLYNAEKLIGLSAQAKILALVIMVLSIISIVVVTIGTLWHFAASPTYTPSIDDFMYYLNDLSPAFIVLIFSMLLRIAAESVLLLMDLEIDLRERSDR